MINQNLAQLFSAMNADEVNIVDCDAYNLHKCGFEEFYHLTDSDVERINATQALYMQKGDVALVRSKNVESLGDHYIVVTGHPIEKKHGLRPQTVEMKVFGETLLNGFPDYEMLVILKLKGKAKYAFYDFHGIQLLDDHVIFQTI